MILQQNDSTKICNWCSRSSEETAFQAKQKNICSECRQGVPKEIIENSNVFYTYIHQCPYSNDIVYVGKGVNYRVISAWGSGSRDPDHAQWMYKILCDGNNPYSVFKIHDYGMSSLEAEKKEAILKTRFLEAGHSLKFCKDIKKG